MGEYGGHGEWRYSSIGHKAFLLVAVNVLQMAEAVSLALVQVNE